MKVSDNWAFPTFYSLLRTGPVQMASARVFTTSGNTVNWRWSFPGRRKVILDVRISRWTYGIVRACMQVVSLFPCFLVYTCMLQPGSSALKEGDDVAALSSMRGQGCQMVAWGIQRRVTTNLILTSRRRLSSGPNILPLTSTLNLTRARVQLYTISYPYTAERRRTRHYTRPVGSLAVCSVWTWLVD